jgi:hypothetical protein
MSLDFQADDVQKPLSDVFNCQIYINLNIDFYEARSGLWISICDNWRVKIQSSSSLPAKGLGPLRLERRILPCLMSTAI